MEKTPLVVRIAAGAGKLLLTCVLLIGTFTLILTLVQLIRLPMRLDRSLALTPLAVGFGGGLLFFSLISRLLIVYVFGHELTHLLVAKLFRRRTGRFRIRSASGSVAVERPNVWITLAPYFVPVYTLAWTGAYGVTLFCWRQPAPDWLVRTFAAGLGVTYAFHLRLTAHALRLQQTDLHAYGKSFSLALIAFCNLLLLTVGIVAATGGWGDAGMALRKSVNAEVEMTVSAAEAVERLFSRLSLPRER